MRKIFFAFIIFLSATSFTQAQEIIKGMKNNAVFLKGSRAMPQVRFKDGSMIMMMNGDDGMSFTLIKNGKETPMFDPSKDYTFGQVSEFDIDADGTMEMLIGTRKTPSTFEVRIYKKAQFDTDYKLFTTINGQDHCEFAGDNTVKIYTEDLKISHLKFKSDGTWVVLEQ